MAFLRFQTTRQWVSMRRDAHPKMHGLVQAEFIVEANLPEDLAIGLFRDARRYLWMSIAAHNTIDIIADNFRL
jgi:hypothetical protein